MQILHKMILCDFSVQIDLIHFYILIWQESFKLRNIFVQDTKYTNIQIYRIQVEIQFLHKIQNII